MRMYFDKSKNVKFYYLHANMHVIIQWGTATNFQVEKTMRMDFCFTKKHFSKWLKKNDIYVWKFLARF